MASTSNTSGCFSGIVAELGKTGGPELPNAWISGFYGSGKSIFAKLLGLALDGVALPDGTSLAEALLRRDTSPLAAELRDAWRELRQKIDPLAVVFDIGSVARDNEHIHSAAVRQVQRKLGYCSTEPIVADFELRLERDGKWADFEKAALETLGHPWADAKDKQLAEEDFSHVMSMMFPEKYTDPMSWYTSRAGTHARAESPEEAVAAIRDMLRFRRPGATLFLVVDEVSQYVISNKDRVDRLRAFATALGATLKGKVWLLALGQQKLDEDAGDSFLIWAKDRFPPSLRVHLAATNIRDVVHKRLLQKKPRARGPASVALRDAPREPEAVRVRVREHHRRGVRRGVPDAAGSYRSPVADHERAPDQVGTRTGRRPGHSRSAAASRRALPRSEARGDAGRRTRHAGPDL